MLVKMWWKNPSYTVGGKWVQLQWKTIWGFFKNLKRELPHFLAMLVLDFSDENKNTNLKIYMHPSTYCSIIGMFLTFLSFLYKRNTDAWALFWTNWISLWKRGKKVPGYLIVLKFPQVFLIRSKIENHCCKRSLMF